MSLSARSAVLVPLVLVAGCVSYERAPLDPVAELSALARRQASAVVVTRSVPGDEAGRVAKFDPSDGFDEAELVALALTLSPDLAARRLEIGAAEALLVEASIWPNPEIGVDWRTGLAGAAGHTLDADLIGTLLRPAERAARTDAAAARIAEVRAEIVAAEWEKVREVRERRIAVLAQEAALALFAQQDELRVRALDLVRRGKELGETKDLDLLSVELELAAIRRDRRRAEIDAASARRDLNRSLGLPPEAELTLTGTLSVAVPADVAGDELDRRVLGRADLAALAAGYERAEQELRLAVERQFPSLKLGPSFGREDDGSKFLGIGAGIDVPLFDRNQGEIAEKHAERESARARYVAQLFEIRAQAHDAAARLRSARAEWETEERDVAPLVARTESLFDAAFRARELSVLDWIAAEERVLEARRAQLETAVRLQEAVIALDAATGRGPR